MPPELVQEHLRRAFRRWGLPGRFRVDLGFPWGSAHDWPPPLALWAVGLGLGMHWNPPACPQHNGVVERSQGTSQRWAEPATCASPEELQRRLDELDRVQRERYPSVAGRSRWEAFSGLRHSGRPYTRAWERRHWDLALVRRHLAGYVVARAVDRSGKVSIYDWPYHLGARYAGAQVHVQFDPQEGAWVVTDAQDRQLRRFAAEEVSRSRIVGLRMSRRR